MKDEAREFLNNYRTFCDGVTSDESQSTEALIARMRELESQGCQVARLNTAQAGLGAEAGEFGEVVKKILFQGKEYNEANIFHMQRELGDAMWYIIQACIALNIDPIDVILMNIEKLESRYPGGKFDPFYSENRQDGDI